MRKMSFLFLLLLFTAHEGIAGIQHADQITYDWLVKTGDENGDTDHVQHMRKIFKKLNPSTLLEFSVGYPTKYFLDSCDRVISVEFVTHGYGPQVIKPFLELYRDYTHWTPIIFFSGYIGETDWAPNKFIGSDSVYKACSHQCVSHQNYALIDKYYVSELKVFINNLCRTNKVDMAFVDSGLFLRGDLVQLLFDKVPIIVAHDTKCRFDGEKDDVFGYSRVKKPENYREIYFPLGKGTTVWIIQKTEYDQLTEEMKKYSKTL